MPRETTIDQLHAEDREIAANFFNANGGTSPTFMIHTENNEVHVVSVDPNDIPKRRAYLLIGLMCIARDALAMSMIAEAWVVDARPEDSEGPMVPPSQREDRWEVLSVVSVFRNGGGEIEYRHSVMQIERQAEGKPTLGGLETSAEIEGPVAAIFPKRRPSEDEQRQAQELLDRFGFLERVQVH